MSLQMDEFKPDSRGIESPGYSYQTRYAGFSEVAADF